MKKFIVLMTQSGGCDYTIGCGMNWKFVEAEDKAGALKAAFGDPAKVDAEAANDPSSWTDENAVVSGLGSEGCPDKVVIYELGEIHATAHECQQAYDAVQKRFDAIEDEEEKADTETAERQQYEALKKKFEAKGK